MQMNCKISNLIFFLLPLQHVKRTVNQKKALITEFTFPYCSTVLVKSVQFQPRQIKLVFYIVSCV